MTQREATPTDFRLPSRLSNALGLPRLRSSARSLFGSRDLAAIRIAAAHLNGFLVEESIDRIERRPLDEREFGPDVYEVTGLFKSIGGRTPSPRPLYIVHKTPLDKVAISSITIH